MPTDVASFSFNPVLTSHCSASQRDSGKPILISGQKVGNSCFILNYFECCGAHDSSSSLCLSAVMWEEQTPTLQISKQFYSLLVFICFVSSNNADTKHLSASASEPNPVLNVKTQFKRSWTPELCLNVIICMCYSIKGICLVACYSDIQSWYSTSPFN